MLVIFMKQGEVVSSTCAENLTSFRASAVSIETTLQMVGKSPPHLVDCPAAEPVDLQRGLHCSIGGLAEVFPDRSWLVGFFLSGKGDLGFGGSTPPSSTM